MAAADFETAVQRLLTQVGHWEAARWGAPTQAVTSTRGQAVFGLVQRLADHTADLEQRPHRPVPRLADTVLPDQLRVMADDLLTAGPPDDLLASATADLTAIRTAL